MSTLMGHSLYRRRLSGPAGSLPDASDGRGAEARAASGGAHPLAERRRPSWPVRRRGWDRPDQATLGLLELVLELLDHQVDGDQRHRARRPGPGWSGRGRT